MELLAHRKLHAVTYSILIRSFTFAFLELPCKYTLDFQLTWLVDKNLKYAHSLRCSHLFLSF